MSTTIDTARSAGSLGSAASATGSAGELLSLARDPASGQLDTRRLAGWVAQASQHDFGKASAAHAAIETELAGRDAGALARFNQDVVAAVAGLAEAAPNGLAAAGQAWASEGRRLLVDNPILVKQWVSTTSAWTGKSGFTDGLRAMLESHGITVERLANPVPPGSLGKSSGVPASLANNRNGDLARDAIADRWRAQGLQVEIEQPRQGGHGWSMWWWIARLRIRAGASVWRSNPRSVATAWTPTWPARPGWTVKPCARTACCVVPATCSRAWARWHDRLVW